MKLWMLPQAILVAVLALGTYPAASCGSEDTAIEPSALEVLVHPDHGIDLEITYELGKLGRVSVSVVAADEGTGALLITLDDETVGELEITSWQFTGMEPGLILPDADARALADSLVQISHSEPVREALLHAGRGKWGCWLAGKIAGAAAGILSAGTCAALAGPLAPGCLAPGSLGFKSVDNYVAGKCNTAQNGSREFEAHA